MRSLRARRAAAQRPRRALQAQAAEATAGAVPVIVRNAGGGGSRDVHLENFSVSNGGQDLIEVRWPLLALTACAMYKCGRRFCARLYMDKRSCAGQLLVLCSPPPSRGADPSVGGTANACVTLPSVCSAWALAQR
jgi:hypothetical protein